MEIQLITICSKDLSIFEKMMAEFSKQDVEFETEPRFFVDNVYYKYAALIKGTKEKAELIRTKLKSIESEILC